MCTELGTKADLSRDRARVDGKLLRGCEAERYFVLNKPRGYVTTMADPEGRPTVASLLGESAQKKVTGEHSKLPRLYPVGRLDYLSEGLLLMTNDGGLANRLSKASGGVQKTYLVKVAGKPSGESLEQLRRGIMIDRGRLNEVRAGRRDRIMTQPAKIEQVRAAAITGGIRGHSPPKAAIGSYARCSRRWAIMSRRSAASATAR